MTIFVPNLTIFGSNMTLLVNCCRKNGLKNGVGKEIGMT